MATVIIRNGHKLCAKCRANGCERFAFGQKDVETDYVSDEPCSCCGPDFETPEDDFGA